MPLLIYNKCFLTGELLTWITKSFREAVHTETDIEWNEVSEIYLYIE